MLQCSTLNVLLWVLLAFWFGAARRDGWPGAWTWGPLMFAWATVATLALLWWLLLSTRGPVSDAPTTEPPTMAQMAAAIDPPEPEKRLPRINGKYVAEMPTVDEDADMEQRVEMLREKYRGKDRNR
jgi:hypothetical protein